MSEISEKNVCKNTRKRKRPSPLNLDFQPDSIQCISNNNKFSFYRINSSEISKNNVTKSRISKKKGIKNIKLEIISYNKEGELYNDKWKEENFDKIIGGSFYLIRYSQVNEQVNEQVIELGQTDYFKDRMKNYERLVGKIEILCVLNSRFKHKIQKNRRTRKLEQELNRHPELQKFKTKKNSESWEQFKNKPDILFSKLDILIKKYC